MTEAGSSARTATATVKAARERYRARYATMSEDNEARDVATGSLTMEQLAILSAMPASTAEQRDAWWGMLRERLDRA